MNDNFLKHMNPSPFYLFCQELDGKQIKRRDNDEEIPKSFVFKDYNWTYVVDDLLHDRHEKYYLADKPKFKPENWQEETDEL